MFKTHSLVEVEYERLQPIARILVDNLVTLAKAYAEATGVKLTTVGTNSTKTASFYIDLQHAPKGRDEPTSARRAR
jgi:hypothetical protein